MERGLMGKEKSRRKLSGMLCYENQKACSTICSSWDLGM